MLPLFISLAAALPAAQPVENPDDGIACFTEARVVKDQLQWNQTELVPLTVEREVEEVVNGKAVRRKVPETTITVKTKVVSESLKKVKAIDVAGKPIPADKLAEQLKEWTTVVCLPGKLTDKQRALFKEGTIFIEMPPPAPGAPTPVPPIAVPVPAPVPMPGK